MMRSTQKTTQVQEHAVVNVHKHKYIFAESIIEQQGIQVQTYNRAVDIDYSKNRRRNLKSHYLTQ